ncbi:hypothetical protein GYMLUDRAFT_913154 [Collybiopsis luxurians FD-317 M1]|nr:hypothetical protein GYMLUDRAFT_913154 [Collybiopsis luxurians FD-317 M1]
MVPDIIRDSTAGQVVNFFSNGRLFPYQEQRSDFAVPAPFLATGSTIKSSGSGPCTLQGEIDPAMSVAASTEEKMLVMNELERDKKSGASPDPNVVGWYSDNDPDNPRNWSSAKRAFVAFSIGLMTFSMYIGSAIYTPSIPGIMAEFRISLPYATLGLSLFVLGYGVGPMFLSPLQELPHLGRNTVYMTSLFLWLILQIPIIFATNVQTILAFRFLSGFFGSPAIATGGATMADVYPSDQVAYVVGIWAMAGVGGPIIGPLIGGFAAQENGWRWPQYEYIWLSTFSFIFLVLLLPETYEPTILLKRAQRLRKLTGNRHLMSQGEKDSQGESITRLFREALLRPFVLAKEPALMFANVFLGFVYAMFYLWFESFPLVFADIYHFNLGLSGLPFLGFLVSGAITYTAYALYLMYYFEPRSHHAKAEGKELPPEARLEIGLITSLSIPISLFIFGWASRESVHWIVPIIGAALYLPGLYLNVQSIMMYTTSAYPRYAASVLAGNALCRSTMACVFPLFGRAFFVNLGLGPGSSLLAGISLGLMVVFGALWKWGHVLRHRSKYAEYS